MTDTKELYEIYQHLVRLLDEDRRFVPAHNIEWTGQIQVSVVGEGVTLDAAVRYFREMLPPEVKVEKLHNSRCSLIIEFPFDLGEAMKTGGHL